MARLTPSAGSILVRMYRQGHGDCFLMAFPGDDGAPRYVLIDCGLKKKSEINADWPIEKIIKDIGEATDNHIHVVVVTHEHEDHVSGFLARSVDDPTAKAWDSIVIDEVWLAWTEDRNDELANQLRKRFEDTLLALIGLTGDPSGNALRSGLGFIGEALAFHTGEEDVGIEVTIRAAQLQSTDPNLSLREAQQMAIAGVSNKKAIKFIRDHAEKGVNFLRPDKGPYEVPGVSGLRVFALGPPRDAALLLSLDPQGAEEFRMGMVSDRESRTLLAAYEEDSTTDRPFGRRYGLQISEIAGAASDEASQFFISHYGLKATPSMRRSGRRHLPRAPHPNDWRRIDDDWLGTADELALRLNSEVNNTSLVLAFELPNTGKVLLFAGDAQRGSWVSWSKLSWRPDAPANAITARDLLSRCVLYKVGHHGSHNATLNGAASDDYANLSWMAQDEFREEFTAMIPANEPWALDLKPVPWRHPLKAIYNALQKKARGRVLQSDKGAPIRPDDVSEAEWANFSKRTKTKDHYFEYEIHDSWYQ
ncbi:hypothetical protein J2Z31_002815 [Sinorhizobium kostiense]|uniref:Metallo-beta-lactamase domain-containing protein n=1 Tax=Sinorhizobium kostiense TaxID=76747 RepID=A0ABS4R070_9HYPH|nr:MULTISPECIES: hypothetical protein [Sinorhizobium]MBP2236301.1 hypothetical protein [Sinorhizobium kostiense]PST20703.1 hypothetical protein C7U60_14835 [Mesorhizobium plurifarium]